MRLNAPEAVRSSRYAAEDRKFQFERGCVAEPDRRYAPVSVNALKSVDLPTFGRPTMPHLKPMGA